MSAQEDFRSVTQLLGDLREGKEDVVNELFPLVYAELHNLAQSQRQFWQGDQTLNTTALVHEAYLKLVDQKASAWSNRAHFYGVAAKAMRHILINYAKFRRRKKRGGDQQKLSIDENRLQINEVIDLSEERSEMLLSLDEALVNLASFSLRQSQIVECRFFGGMSIADTAEALNISPATVKRGWAMAQAWLYKEMQAENGK
ncbi:MAG: sigma-70 family RNA polymerase sigma factor [Rhodothermales bacterium]